MEFHPVNGTAFQRTGPTDMPTVILVHGLGLNRDCWQWTVPALNASGFHVIAYDLFGHGDSAAPPETPSLAVFSRQLLELMDHCGLQDAAIAGFSLGGMIARRFAQDHAERTKAIAILHSPHRRTPQAQQAILDRVELARAVGPAATVEAALERWYTAEFRKSRPDVMDLTRSWVLANDPAVYPTVYKVLADGIDEIIAPNPPISCPAMVLTGDEDYGNGPEMSRAIAAEIPDAEIHILSGLRHMALVERPDAVNTPLIRFLNRTMYLGSHA